MTCRVYRVIITSGAAGSGLVMVSFLYKMMCRFAEFAMLRLRADVDPARRLLTDLQQHGYDITQLITNTAA
jgi:hypothetical protein